MHLPLSLPLLTAILSLSTTITAWHCAKTDHTLYRPTCCDEVKPRRGKFAGVDCYQPFPVLAGNTTVKNEYTCVFQGTTFGFPGCCKSDDKKKDTYSCKPVVV
ncbi:hypothetical protein DL95DRAFT_444500 [Leptodontidium sp. 2 PMI_412]|nr:hypothetical protein DL95DRAFT_444500 [Leptodontidium sp. 2 PMI_412]